MAMIQKCFTEGQIGWPKSVNRALLSREYFARIDCEFCLKATNITEIARADRDMEQHLAACG